MGGRRWRKRLGVAGCDLVCELRGAHGVHSGASSAAAHATTWLGTAAQEVVLGVASGDRPPLSTAPELRLGLLEALHEVGGPNAKISDDELAIMLRVTATQARTLKRNLRARRPDLFEEHLADELKGLVGEKDGQFWQLTAESPDVLEYAAERLRRVGMTRNVELNRVRGTLRFPIQGEKASGGGKVNSQAELGFKKK